MQNKYRPSRKKSVQNTNKNKKTLIILTAVLAVIAIALSVVLIIQSIEKTQPVIEPTIPKPACSDKTVYTEDVYSYMLLDDGTAMISGCKISKDVADLTLPSELGGKKVTAIGSSAFAFMTWVRKLTIPEGITYIGESAFSACGADIVNLPSSLLYIDKDAFSVCDYIKFARYPSAEEWKKVTVGSGNSSLTRNMTFA